MRERRLKNLIIGTNALIAVLQARSAIKIDTLPADAEIVNATFDYRFNGFAITVYSSEFDIVPDEYMLETMPGQWVVAQGQTASIPKQLRSDGVPRRNDMTLWTDEEKRLRDVHQMIEGMGADPHLTDAGTLILQAHDKLADYLETKELL